jgi:hypothetical protein
MDELSPTPATLHAGNPLPAAFHGHGLLQSQGGLNWVEKLPDIGNNPAASLRNQRPSEQ